MIHVDPDPVTIGGAANSTVDVTLICPMGWTLHDLPDWLTASPAASPTGTGALGAPVTFTAQVNPNTSTRSATLTFTASNGDKVKLTVTQAVNSGFSLTLAHVTGQTDGYGTVEITTGAATDNIGGTSVTVKANPAGVYTFLKWVATNDRGATAVQNGATDAAAEFTFDITANTTLYAVFQGNGTAAAPIEVATVAQLNDVRNQLLWNYILMADLDLGVNPYNTDSGWSPIGTFTGVFDGNGHTISNLYINRGGSDNIGLFRYV
ncbi:MAG: BACON domain-containing protein, partial [Bacteroidales bacterium]|nr:BACON domain-containing protein [Bacteroidales bacterium]